MTPRAVTFSRNVLLSSSSLPWRRRQNVSSKTLKLRTRVQEPQPQDLPRFGFFRLPRGVSRLAVRIFPDTRELSRRTRHYRRSVGAQYGMCELARHGTAGERHGTCELAFAQHVWTSFKSTITKTAMMWKVNVISANCNFIPFICTSGRSCLQNTTVKAHQPICTTRHL